MRSSLEEFLSLGRLGDLRPGMSREEIQQALGAPDATGGTSRKQRTPSIYKYGDLELFFSALDLNICRSMYIEPSLAGPIRLPSALGLEEWDLPARSPRQVVEGYLRSRGLLFDRRPGPTPDTNELVIRPSRVVLAFDEEEKLSAIHLELAD